jgi:hypothetical protein
MSDHGFGRPGLLCHSCLTPPMAAPIPGVVADRERLLSWWRTVPMPVTSPSPRRASSLLIWLLGVGAGLLLSIVLGGAIVRLVTGTSLFHLREIFRGSRTQINLDQPTVVMQIQQLQRLETVSYTMDKIISGGSDSPYLPKFLVGDRLLLLVHGEVIAGIDLARVQSGDVTVHDRNISLRLPPAEVFSTRLDNAKTRVYSRDTGLFSSADPNLETEVRQEGDRELQQSALQDGILAAADRNAHNTMKSFLQGLGFKQVTIQ